MPTSDGALSRRSVLKSATAGALGLAASGGILPLVSQSVAASAINRPTLLLAPDASSANPANVLIASDYPIDFVNDDAQVRQFPVSASALDGAAGIQVTITMQVHLGDGAVPNSSSGLVITNGLTDDGQRKLFLVYQNGGWNLGYLNGKNFTSLPRILATQDMSGLFSVQIDATGTAVTVTLADGSVKTAQLPDSLYAAKSIMFLSIQVAGHAGVLVSQLTFSDGSSSGTTSDGPSLRSLADQRGFAIGAATSGYDMNDNPHYNAIMSRDFSQLFPTAEFGWETLRPSRDRFNFLRADQMVSYARQRNMQMIVEPLVWDQAFPAWLDGVSNDDASQILEQHIRTVVGRYKGKGVPIIYSVANEMLVKNGSFRQAFWVNKLGIDPADGIPYCIKNALRWARDADPDAKLMIDDTSNEVDNPLSRGMVAMIGALKAQGVPIDAVGLQMHLRVYPATTPVQYFDQPPPKDALVAMLQKYASLGVDVHVTSMDVNVEDGVPGVTPDDLQRQAEVYRIVTEACIDSGVCKGLSFWQPVEKFSWLLKPEWQYLGGGEAPGLFDDGYNPKPAYFAIRDTLANYGR